jgi:hypothetical protein
MVPAEVVTGTVSMSANAGTKPSHFFDEFIARLRCEVFIHEELLQTYTPRGVPVPDSHSGRLTMRLSGRQPQQFARHFIVHGRSNR